VIRKCDGQDAYLTKMVPDRETDGVKRVPCDCGRRFDDVAYSTIYPHPPIGGAGYGSLYSMKRNGF